MADHRFRRSAMFLQPVFLFRRQVLGQEAFHRRVEIKAVFFVVEAVAFVILHHVFDRHAALAQAFDDLVRLRLVDARIVGALRHEQRSLDAVSVQGRRDCRQQLLVLDRIADHLVHLVEERFPVRRDGLHEGEHVGDADIIDRRRIQVRREGDSGQRRIPAVGAAVDRYPLGIGDALLDQPLHAIGDVVLHGLAPLLERRFPELAAVAGRAAVVHLQHGIAAVGQQLHFRVVAPDVAHPRAAVRIDDHRQVLRIFAERQRQVAVDHQAVARLVLHRLHFRHVFFGDGGIDVGQPGQRAALAVEQVAAALGAVVVGGHDPGRFVLGVRLRDDFVAGQFFLQGLVQGFALRIEEFVLGFPGGVADLGQHLAFLRVSQAFDVDFGVFIQQLLFLGGFGIEDHDRFLIAAEVGRDIQFLVVEGEEQRVDRILERGGQYGLERRAFGGAVQQAGVDAVGSGGGPDLAVVVGDPALDVAGILGHKLFGAALDVDAVDVEHFRIALVVADQDFILVVFQVVDDLGAHLGVGRKVFQALAVAAHRHHVEIFIAAEILGEQDVIVAFPEITADVARFLGGDAQRRGVRTDGPDKDVHAALPGLHEADVFAVGRNLEAALLRIAEEIAHRILLERACRQGIAAQYGQAETCCGNHLINSAHQIPPKILQVVVVSCRCVFCRCG
ncbi:hypothetical protein CFU_0697 [Collimonas fungivorans Ter331]|uniref:NAD-specific glutamate dehydrogenase n=1 Tax=Collimonas fungivorans (strain Ter331) TaxID=1005048 RepID=G0AF04_COLFT|nr:hypothetical protein CFU_0697 [Collimonas fungivorans Ter331]